MAGPETSHRSKLKLLYPDCWRWLRLARRIPGHLTEREASLLFRLARARTPVIEPRILEVGAEDGQGSLLLAAGLSGKIRPKLIVAGSAIPLDQPNRFRVLERCGLAGIVEIAASPPAGCIDILVVHAGQDSNLLRRELARWLGTVKPGGIVVLRGISPEAGAEMLQPPRYSDFRNVDGLVWAVNWCAPPSPSVSSSDLLIASREAMLHMDPTPAFLSGDDATALAAARLQDYVGRAATEFAEERHAVEALRNSWSWRLTAPLRWGIEVMQAITGSMAAFRRGPAKARWDGLSQWIRFGTDIRTSGLLDERYYRFHAQAPWARTNPVLHFFICGASEGNNPNELFDIHYYLARYPDVAGSGLNPLVHYLKVGAYRGYNPHPYFESGFYLEQNLDVRDAGINPLAHYLASGIAEGRDPNPWFDTSEYLEQTPDVATFGLNPLVHQLAQFQPCSRS